MLADDVLPALRQPGDHLAGPRAMLGYPSQHAHCDLAPADLALRGASLRSQWYHDTIGTQGQGQSRQGSGQWFRRRRAPLGHGVQFHLEVGHGLVASRLHPTPDRSGTDGAPDGPGQQPSRRGKRHKDREGTAQGLEFPAGALLRRPPEDLIQEGHLRDGAALRAAADPAFPTHSSSGASHSPYSV